MNSSNPVTYRNRTLLLILGVVILKLVISDNVDLGNDESYYWLYSLNLKWNYFDHPPMVGVWIRLFTANLLLDQYEVFVRSGAILGSALATWFIYKCVCRLSSARAGWFAACLYSASFYAGVTSGLFIFPDSPQMVFFTFSLWMIAELTLNDKNWSFWILLGIASGLCIMSKVHGIFIWVGLGTYIIIFRRSWLANPKMYVSILITLLIVSPILIWTVHYDFLTYRFNSGRIVIKGYPLNWHSFFSEIVGQFLINNPFNVVFVLVSLLGWLRYQKHFPKALTVYNFIALPLITLLLLISLYRTTLPHWSGPAYVALIPFAAISLESLSKAKYYPKLLILSLGVYILFMIACPFFINYYPGHLGSNRLSDLGKGDITLDMVGWREAGKQFESLYKKEISAGLMPENTPVVCNKWWGAHVEYYFCRPLNIQMIGLGEMNELHEYTWMNNKRKSKVDMSTAYCIVNSDDYYNVHDQYRDYYSQVDTIQIIHILRGHQPAHDFVIYRLKGWKNNLPIKD